MSLPVIKEKASPRRRNPIFQFSFFGKPSPQRIKEHFENLEQQSELLKGIPIFFALELQIQKLLNKNTLRNKINRKITVDKRNRHVQRRQHMTAANKSLLRYFNIV